MGFIDWKNNRIDQFDEIKEFAEIASENDIFFEKIV